VLGPRQLHCARQLLALTVEPDDQRCGAVRLSVLGRLLGCLAGVADATGQHRRRQPHANGLLHRRSAVRERGFIADSQTGFIINGSQQQFLVRDSSIGGWSNGVWNQVFSGVVGAPPQSFSTTPYDPPPYTTLDSSPLTRERPFLYVDSSDDYNVFVPALRRNSSGTTWASGPAAGSSIPIEQFFIAQPTDDAKAINKALARGQNLIFTPGVYHLDRAIDVKRADTVVLGLGFPTLVPDNGAIAMTVADVKGVKLARLLFDAGPVNSPVLLQSANRTPIRATRTTRRHCRTCSSASAARPPARRQSASSSTATTSS
jgi:hypothetical protein